MKKQKKGFTVVELVIVIAVIAILAAVLIPTFATLVEKARRSTDEQLCRNYNTILAAEKAFDADGVVEVREARNMIEANGFNTNHFSTSSAKLWFAYDKEATTFALVEKSTGDVVYPKGYSKNNLYALFPTDGKSFINGFDKYFTISAYTKLAADTPGGITIDANDNIIDATDAENKTSITVSNGRAIGNPAVAGDAQLVATENIKPVGNGIKNTSAEGQVGTLYDSTNLTTIGTAETTAETKVLTIENKVFTGTGADECGIILSVGAEYDKLVIKNCNFYGTGLFIYSAHHKDVEIIGNNFVNSGYNGGKAIKTRSAGRFVIKDNHFQDCKVGVMVTAGAESMEISNNTFDLKEEAKPKSTNGKYSAVVRLEDSWHNNTATKLTIKNNKINYAGSVVIVHHTFCTGTFNNTNLTTWLNNVTIENNTFRCDKVAGYGNSSASEFESGDEKELLDNLAAKFN